MDLGLFSFLFLLESISIICISRNLLIHFSFQIYYQNFYIPSSYLFYINIYSYISPFSPNIFYLYPFSLILNIIYLCSFSFFFPLLNSIRSLSLKNILSKNKLIPLSILFMFAFYFIKCYSSFFSFLLLSFDLFCYSFSKFLRSMV